MLPRRILAVDREQETLLARPLAVFGDLLQRLDRPLRIAGRYLLNRQ
jgi:hypothetical protein